MSQWTHISGVIRYDSMAKNVFPEPWNKNAILDAEMELVSNAYQSPPEPYGSEGGLQLNFVLTKRGPTVLITGDLRDFGTDDLPSILKWVQEADVLIQARTTSMLHVRDCHINCDVEFDDYLRVITEDVNGEFQLDSYIVTAEKNYERQPYKTKE